MIVGCPVLLNWAVSTNLTQLYSGQICCLLLCRYTAGSQSFSMVLAAFEAQADADLAGMGIYQVVRS